MPSESAIEWTDATWNPVTGCTKVSAGCKNCFAEALFPRVYGKRKFTDVQVHPERLDWPLRWRGSPKAKAEGRPSRIFVNSMSDLFHENVPTKFVYEVFMCMWSAQDHTFQILTKRPQRMLHLVKTWLEVDRKLMRAFAPDALPGGGGIERLCQPLNNVWLGVSVEDQKTADERIPILLQTPAAIRWVSYEPALGPVDFERFLPSALLHSGESYCGDGTALDWIVPGGESGPNARPPHPDWFRSARDQCNAAGVAFFFKQWGTFLPSDQETRATVPSAESLKAPLEMIYMGKKAAGCLLDGREHKEFPKL